MLDDDGGGDYGDEVDDGHLDNDDYHNDADMLVLEVMVLNGSEERKITSTWRIDDISTRHQGMCIPHTRRSRRKGVQKGSTGWGMDRKSFSSFARVEVNQWLKREMILERNTGDQTMLFVSFIRQGGH